MALRGPPFFSYENTRWGGGGGCWGCQSINRFLQTVRSLTPRDRDRLSYACSPLPGATRGNAFKAARIKLPRGVIKPPRNITTSKRSRPQRGMLRPVSPATLQREPPQGHFRLSRCRRRRLANYHENGSYGV